MASVRSYDVSLKIHIEAGANKSGLCNVGVLLRPDETAGSFPFRAGYISDCISLQETVTDVCERRKTKCS